MLQHNTIYLTNSGVMQTKDKLCSLDLYMIPNDSMGIKQELKTKRNNNQVLAFLCKTDYRWIFIKQKKLKPEAASL